MRIGLRLPSFVALVLAMWLGAARAATLELVEATRSELFLNWTWTGESSMQTVEPNGGWTIDVSWTPPPAVIGPEGFSLTLTVTATGQGDHVYAGIGANSDGLQAEPFPHIELEAEAGETVSDTITVQVTPRDVLETGQRVRLSIGPNNGPGIDYYYTVVTGGGGLQVTDDCPDTIVISALPSVNCHLIITGWRRNTADPIIVTLPNAIDTFGNHANGIQVLGRGEEDIFNWDEPHLWGLFVFACPSQDTTGANCYESVTVPGPVTVPILVQQGDSPPVQVDLDFVAVPHP